MSFFRLTHGEPICDVHAVTQDQSHPSLLPLTPVSGIYCTSSILEPQVRSQCPWYSRTSQFIPCTSPPQRTYRNLASHGAVASFWKPLCCLDHSTFVLELRCSASCRQTGCCNLPLWCILSISSLWRKCSSVTFGVTKFRKPWSHLIPQRTLPRVTPPALHHPATLRLSCQAFSSHFTAVPSRTWATRLPLHTLLSWRECAFAWPASPSTACSCSPPFFPSSCHCSSCLSLSVVCLSSSPQFQEGRNFRSILPFLLSRTIITAANPICKYVMSLSNTILSTLPKLTHWIWQLWNLSKPKEFMSTILVLKYHQ